jgi:hypothetical protein
VLMGCSTKTAKVVAISLGSLQRLIALKAVPQSSIQLIINTMGDAMSQGVDIQLRILQTLLSLITNFPSVHGELLGDVSNTNHSLLSRRSLLRTRHCYYASSSRNQGSQSSHQRPQQPLGNSLCLCSTR